jgi:hypothetical protein
LTRTKQKYTSVGVPRHATPHHTTPHHTTPNATTINQTNSRATLATATETEEDDASFLLLGAKQFVVMVHVNRHGR